MTVFKNFSLTTFLFILLGVYLIWLIKEIFFPVFLGIIIGLTLQNFAKFLTLKTKINFYILVFILYLFLSSIFIFIFYSLFKVITTELPNFISHLNLILKNYNLKLEKLPLDSPNFFELTSSYFPNFFSFIYSLFGNFISFLLVFVISFYVALNQDFEKNIFAYIPEQKRENIFNIWFRIKRKLSFWIIGQIILMLSIGIATYIFYGLILNLPYKFLISFTAGILEALAILGPVLTTIIAVFITVIEKPEYIFFVIGGFFVIQQFENHILVPLVMKNAVQLNPILVLVGLLIFSKFFSLWGTISTLPILVILTEIFNFYFKEK